MIEAKVYAAAIGAGAGTVAYEFTLWLLGVIFWHSSPSASNAILAAASVPAPVSGLLALLLTAGGAAIAGYAAPHTPRVVPVDSAVVVSVLPSTEAPPTVAVTQPEPSLDPDAL